MLQARWTAATSFGLAAVCGFVVLTGTRHTLQQPVPAVDKNAQELASTLVSEHSQSVVASEIAGPGITGRESDRGESSSEDSDGDIGNI
jgi:hypothetical protein